MALRAVSPASVDNTRSRLIDAAGEVFAEHGFQRATVRDICARAGVNVALVNYHFGDKLELYTEVLRLSMGAKSEGLRTLLETTGTPEEILRRTIHSMVHHMFAEDRPAWHFRLMVHEMAQPTPAISVVVNETFRPVYDGIRAAAGKFIGLPADHDQARLATHSIISQIAHFSRGRHMIAQLWPEFTITAQRIDQIADHITRFSFTGLEQMRKEHKHVAHKVEHQQKKQQRREQRRSKHA